ncbi:MAG: DGQHR domain-containing protein, partial [Thermoplasmata archaeon]|nr:DGQHR domain-containing protein [Thermoplasmata archaeon]
AIDGYIIELCTKNDIKIWTYEEYFYFQKVAKTEKKYGKYRILEFLTVRPEELEETSDFPLIYLAVGNKINGVYLLNVSIPVKQLLKHVTIKRLQDWSSEGFQRLIDEKKLKKMREYLERELAFYPTNVVLLAREDTTIEKINTDSIQLEISDSSILPDIKRNMRGHLFVVKLPNTYDAFTVIDGQHRLFSYVSDHDNKNINILSTLILIKEEDEMTRSLKDGAKLFYDINQKQTYIKGEDIIDLMEKISPEAPVTKANTLLKKLNENGVLENKIRFKPWQEDRIRRTSLIRYSGLKHIFDEKNKKTYKIFYNAYEKQNKIKDYINFSYVLINNYLWQLYKLVKKKYKENGWGEKFTELSKDMTLKNYYLFSAVFIGAMIRLLRHFLSEKSQREFDILNRLNVVFKDKENANINNSKLQKLFYDGLNEIAKKYDFTKEEFDRQKGWGPNKWAKIEADLYSLIRRKYHNFGDADLLSPKYLK